MLGWQAAELSLVIIGANLLTLMPLIRGLKDRSRAGYTHTGSTHTASKAGYAHNSMSTFSNNPKSTASLSFPDPTAQRMDRLGNHAEVRGPRANVREPDPEIGLSDGEINVRKEVHLNNSRRG